MVIARSAWACSGSCSSRRALRQSNAGAARTYNALSVSDVSPLVTAVLLAPRTLVELSGSIAHLRRQTLSDRIEVVLVHTPLLDGRPDPLVFEGLHSVRSVEIASMPTVAAGFVAGVDAASAPIVALIEDHVFLDPAWAEWVVLAHAGPCAAVAPSMTNANPATVTSWANFFTAFIDTLARGPAGETECGPGHNTSYKRDVLRRYRAELAALYQSERTFHYRLRRDGLAIVAEPRARLAHTNISLPATALRHAFFGGVLFGQYRGIRMGRLERALRTLGAPLVPIVRVVRMARAVRAHNGAIGEAPVLTWAAVPMLLVAHAAGEALGYWRIVTDIEGRYELFELHRLQCVRPDERWLMTGGRATAPPSPVPSA